METLERYNKFAKLFDCGDSTVHKAVYLYENIIWIRGTKACQLLEFSGNSDRTIKTHCHEHQYKRFRIGQGRATWYVNESGFYRLALKSRSEYARALYNWVTEMIPLHSEPMILLPNQN